MYLIGKYAHGKSGMQKGGVIMQRFAKASRQLKLNLFIAKEAVAMHLGIVFA